LPAKGDSFFIRKALPTKKKIAFSVEKAIFATYETRRNH
jgi:hypothetical protein